MESFELFEKNWALVTAGTMERFNCCTIGWGGMGTLWNRPVVTVYVHPARYTRTFLTEQAYFTVSFFPERCKKALGLLGSRSGRDGDKIAASGLTPQPMGPGVGYAEAELSFLCRKLYAHPFDRDALPEELRAYYRDHPKAFPPDENGDWQPHWAFIGEVEQILDRRESNEGKGENSDD